MNRTLLSAFVFAAVVTLLTFQPLLSQEVPTVPEPLPEESAEELLTVGVLCFSGLDSVMADLDFVAELAGNPFLSLMATGGLQQVFGDELLETIDGERSWGFVVRTDGEQFPMVGFVPTIRSQQFLAAVKSKIGHPEETDEGPLEFVIQGQPVYLKLTESWALFSNTPGGLVDLPDDPTELLEGIVGSYDLTAQVVVKNIPKLYRTLAVGGMQMGLQPFMQRAPGETGEQHRLRAGMAQQAIEGAKTLLNELDTIEVGLAIDQESSSARIEYKVTAIKDTETARRLSAGERINTEFAGFAKPDSVLAIGVGAEISKSEAAQLLKATDLMRSRAIGDMEAQTLSPRERVQARTRLTSLMDVLDNLIRGQRIDGTVGVSLKPDALTLLAGLHVPNSRKLESLARNLAEQIAKSAESVAVTFDADELGDVRFHVIAIPVDDMPDATPELRALVGDSLDIVFAFGDDAAYLALGANAIDSLKQAITDSAAAQNTPVPRMRVSIATEPIAQFAAEVGGIEVASMIADMLQEAPDMDHISVVFHGVPNGQNVRIEIEQGLLKVLGSIPQLMIQSASSQQPVSVGQQ